MADRNTHLRMLKDLSIERTALQIEIKESTRFFEDCGRAMNYHYEQIRLLDLVYFCQNGRYP